MRRAVYTFVVVGFLISGCGKFGHLDWPARVTLEGFSESENARITAALQKANETAGREVVHLSSSSEEGSPITIRKVDELQPSTNSQAAMAKKVATMAYQIAGRATYDASTCDIQIAKFVSEPEGTGLLTAVLWHELGHCAGLPHLTEENQLMSKNTLSIGSYSEDFIKRFFADFINSSGLKDK